MTIQRSLPLLLLCIFLTGTLPAQETLTLKQALDYALKNSEAIKKARLDIDGGKYKVSEVRASALPQLEGNADLNYNPIIGKLVFAGQSVTIGKPWDSKFGAQFSQQLFNQQVFTGLKAAQASSDFYKLNADMTEEQVIELVAQNYYQVLVNREQLAVIDTNLKNIRVIEKIVSNQYANGLAKKIDVDRIKVNISNLQNQRQELTNAVLMLENQLKYSMGMPIETAIFLPKAVLEAIPGPDVALTERGDTEHLIELKVINKQLELLDFQYKAYRAEYYPTLSLIGSYSYTTQSDRFNALYTSPGTEVAASFGAAVIGVSLRVPIFNGFATRSRMGQAKVDLLKAQEDKYHTIQSLNLAYGNAKIQLTNALNTIRSQNENKQLAQEVYASTQNNYNNGLASLTDLLDTENALTQAQNSYNQALLNYKVAEIQLKKSTGNIRSLMNE